MARIVPFRSSMKPSAWNTSRVFFVSFPTTFNSSFSGTGFLNFTFSSLVTPNASGSGRLIARPITSSSSAEISPPCIRLG